jgi:plastocyanin
MSKSSTTFIIVAVLALASGSALADGSITGTVEAKPSKFLKDTIVYVKAVPNTKLTAKTVEIDQKGLTFLPHIVLLAVGDTVRFHNHDKVDHNVMSPDGGYDLGTWGFDKANDHVFKTEGVFGQICKLHPEMLAYVFVGQNRFAAAVDDKGAFAIAGLPPGTYELAVWNPKLKASAQKITVVADKAVAAHFALTR